jgi:hypothetical protein
MQVRGPCLRRRYCEGKSEVFILVSPQNPTEPPVSGWVGTNVLILSLGLVSVWAGVRTRW